MIQNTTSMNTDYKKAVPIDLVWGFREAGKTTWIEKLEETVWRGQRVAFLQNESGIVSLSRTKLQPAHTVWNVSNGCLCCSGAIMLAQTLEEIMRKDNPERIVLEAAQTNRIENFRTILRQELGGRYWIDHALYVCNAVTFEKKMMVSERFFEQELASSPVIILNHMQEATEEEKKRIRSCLRKINPDSMTVEENLTDMNPDQLRGIYEQCRTMPAHRKNVLPAYGKFQYKGIRLNTAGSEGESST